MGKKVIFNASYTVCAKKGRSQTIKNYNIWIKLKANVTYEISIIGVKENSTECWNFSNNKGLKAGVGHYRKLFIVRAKNNIEQIKSDFF